MLLTRLIILLSAVAILLLMLLVMMLMHWERRRASDPRLDIAKRRTMEDRKKTLERAIFLQAVPNRSAEASAAPVSVRRSVDSVAAWRGN